VFLKLKPFFCSLIFFLGLELIVFYHSKIFLIVFLLFIFSLYQGRKIGGSWRFSILPCFFVISSVVLSYLVTIKIEQQIFIIIASLIYYLSLFGAYRLGKYGGDQTAKGMISAATFSTIFFTYAGFYGIYLNFLIPLYVLIIAYSIVTILISYQYFSIICSIKTKKDLGENINLECDKKSKVWLYSFLIALFMAEIIWTMNFWPFGYLTTGAIALILYYILWDMIQSYFLDTLNKKRILSNMIFFFFLIFIVLFTSKWLPII
jgi:hypothetical protein